MTQKVQRHAQLKNCEFSEEVQHGVYGLLHWQHIMYSAGHMHNMM